MIFMNSWHQDLSNKLSHKHIELILIFFMFDHRWKMGAPLRGAVKKLLNISSDAPYPIFLYDISTHQNNSEKKFIGQSTSAGQYTTLHPDYID